MFKLQSVRDTLQLLTSLNTITLSVVSKGFINDGEATPFHSSGQCRILQLARTRLLNSCWDGH